jgi:predicted secreted protein
MINIPAQKAKEIRRYVENYEVKQLIKVLTELKVFAKERSILKIHKNEFEFLRKNRLKYSSERLDKRNTESNIAIKTILENIPR